ncbi:MAG: PD-(D/E)XK nuclease family protein, partial [Chloroflexi bacterium]|nr:PD-(D/E)XK nuclease family protein [Chloroflexota bacterium]
MKKLRGAAGYAVEWLQIDHRAQAQEPYIKPSSLAKGCLLYVAFELLGKPKPAFDARIGRILSVGTDSHRRLQHALDRACLGQEVFFEVPEYRIHGLCDGILYIPPGNTTDVSAAGFWALEFKTAAAGEFDKVKAAGIPKEEHVRQAQIYLWGIHEHYQGTIPLKGAIIYYENRDTLEHLAYEVYPDPAAIADLLARVKAMLAALDRGQLPDDTLPQDHWGHTYCPYLDICEPGQKAV